MQGPSVLVSTERGATASPIGPHFFFFFFEILGELITNVRFYLLNISHNVVHFGKIL